MKKIIAGLLAIIAVFGAVPSGNFIVPEKIALTASAATSGTYGSMTYTMYDDYVEITGFDNSVSELEIPSEIEGISVTIIGYEAFRNATKLKSINIPNSITTIDDYAFFNCSALENIYLPPFLNTIGYAAFSNCKSLQSLNIPNNIYLYQTIASSCTSLNSIVIQNPNMDMSALNEYIYNSLDNELNNIYNGTISGYTDSTAQIYAQENNIEFISIGEKREFGCYLSPEYAKITYWDNDSTDAIIPAEIEGVPVTKIAYGAFRDHTNLINVTIPESVTTIEWHAFIGCSNLTNVVVPDSIEYLGAGAFFDTKFLRTQSDVKYVGKWTGGCQQNLQSAIIKEGTIGIGCYSFGGCMDLEYVEIPQTVTYIGQMAFNNCTSLKTITIPTSVTTLCSAIFENTSLTDVYYEGTEEQWNAIVRRAPEDYDGNEMDYSEYDDYKLKNATIHFGEKAPAIEIIKPSEALPLGDINGDSTVDASDASNVLAVYALVSTGKESELTEAQIATADVNKDGSIDASDASLILAYYAYISTGGTGTLEEYLNS